MGRAMVEILAVFAEFEQDALRQRVKAGIVQARKDGQPHGCPTTIAHQKGHIQELYAQEVSKAQIARDLVDRQNIGSAFVEIDAFKRGMTISSGTQCNGTNSSSSFPDKVAQISLAG
jgi:DNA invertase Pin-like site-specific DNA recombinase